MRGPCFILAGILLAVTPAWADPLLRSDHKRVSWRILGAGVNLSESREDGTGVDFEELLSGDGSTKKASATATAETHVFYNPPSPGLGGIFGGVQLHKYVNAHVIGVGFPLSSRADSTFHLEFELAEAMPWTLAGDGRGDSPGNLSVRLASLSTGVLFEFERSGTFDEDFSGGGVLPAGRYTLDFDIDVLVISGSTSSIGSVSGNLAFTVPTPPATLAFLAGAVTFARRSRRLSA